MNKYDYIVLIGRMQLFHLGHKELLDHALKIANKKVIIILGSSFTSRNTKNPFSANEREEMIHSSLSSEEKSKVSFVHQRDYYYNHNRWLTEIQRAVDIHTHESKSVALIGHETDHTSFYLKDFPQWDLILRPEGTMKLHATDLRNMIYEDKEFNDNSDYVKYLATGTISFLRKWAVQNNKEFVRIQEEYKYIKEYRDLWSFAPFPVQFTAVDAITIKSGHVLVVKRKGKHGKGQWALPGGFLNVNETIVNGAIRELKEETRIKVNKDELKSKIKLEKVFDYPGRSIRGRTITHAFLIDLGRGRLPHVKGSDDAEHAKWLPLSDVDDNEEMFFEDHWHIITYFCGML